MGNCLKQRGTSDPDADDVCDVLPVVVTEEGTMVVSAQGTVGSTMRMTPLHLDALLAHLRPSPDVHQA
jgi:hypothetical protein